MRRKCDIILIVVIKEVRGYEKPEPTAWLLFRTQGDSQDELRQVRDDAARGRGSQARF